MISKLPTLDPLDRRLNPLDDNGALMKGSGEFARIKVAFTDLRGKPDFSASIDTQLLFGEDVEIIEVHKHWTRVKATRDGYVGWLESLTLTSNQTPITHLVSVPRTFFYPEPNLKLPHKGMRSMGSGLVVVGTTEVRGTRYALLEGGEAVIEKHIRPADVNETDYVAVAETLVKTPYLWAGTTAFGLDCSGIIKLSQFMCGQFILRDSDMQAATFGEEIDPGRSFQNVQRGDLIFWRGHVAIAQGNGMILHANGHTMDVASEPLADAVERIAYLYEMPIGVRRGS